ncbi:hypothetical protein JWG39_02520 [Desulforhopalus vacuolatus]|uniref:hypothetical protein n=1 Tax=Desulforhopalus vacuolatus TaxID=40414 RepID=UPI0019644144|nr:hypothetical protein [Desulforhopalus vacuolatus]MBM9518691.1 hypothetical protein [Desulforhopalus vacuolatus]
MKMIFFPRTDICSIRQFPLFLPAPQLLIMQGWRREASETLNLFTKAGFCQVKVPVPFADTADEKRFLHLIEDITTRRDDYAGQLSSLTLAGMTEPEKNEEHSERAILGALTGQTKVPVEHEEEQWQARLVLALGEILDREEEDIAAELATLDDNTHELFEDLQGEAEKDEESLFAELREVQQNLTPTRSGIVRRVHAWCTLFGAACGDGILLTDSEDAADILINRYEKASVESVVHVTNFPLPALVGRNAGEAIEKIAAFHQQYQENVKDISRWLTEMQNGSAVLEMDNIVSWEKALESAFPAAEYGRRVVEVRLFRGGFGRIAAGETSNGVMLVVKG